MFDPFIAPSGTLLGLLQRGRGDGTLHALAAPRAEALAALNHCVLSDPRHDWQVENRSLYYARLYLDLDGGIEEIEQHLSDPDDHIDTDDSRTGLALAVLGHLASYGRSDALALLRRYAATGANWAWALDELALRDDDAGLRTLAVPVLARFPDTEEGTAELAAAVRDAFEPRPWRLWADDPREAVGPRVRSASEQGSFDRWQRQMRPGGPRPGWSVQAVFDWAQQGLDRGTPLHVPAARCLTAVAGPDDRPVIVEAARSGTEGARCAALHYLSEARDPVVLDLIETAAVSPSRTVADAAVAAFERMCGDAAVDRARIWARRPDALGASAAGVLACRGGDQDASLVLAALRDAVRGEGPDAQRLWTLVDGTGRLGIACAAPVLRHVYRETSSSHLRGRAARALAATDPSFATGFAVECLWDCEETTREVAALHAETGDIRVAERLRRLAADPAEEAEVQTAVRSRIGPDTPAV
ncbi:MULTISPECIES: HEAT repeat domain-containing protein [unclassified Streptomyces]|uniref:HEAT repeat domain-containing protein n=1 Tax=unclassified Streptomyces TaxID=2593676 RepID=UPI002DDBC10A|nr:MULTISPECIES: HEAT repeat domain-containing protein [unclassified Streptomyces]WSF88003.1 HEAT repeat domain-containing protein [Streptomyces sp. NBC_01744]WSC35760.1 HEAT repeat domain-containing protein [Streptomyces sp. NBC_01763]WSC43890.1 HEAT repeat domain-containing protein [Streptomyces sp. NBC_01762]WSC57157.1 HEAT repeat domain-containing protein [Streptomyces sp. NBC_01761]WSD23477.1 HEAT repeat domain-containing protein [Streptomyces sp. NBC_01751]